MNKTAARFSAWNLPSVNPALTRDSIPHLRSSLCYLVICAKADSPRMFFGSGVPICFAIELQNLFSALRLRYASCTLQVLMEQGQSAFVPISEANSIVWYCTAGSVSSNIITNARYFFVSRGLAWCKSKQCPKQTKLSIKISLRMTSRPRKNRYQPRFTAVIYSFWQMWTKFILKLILRA